MDYVQEHVDRGPVRLGVQVYSGPGAEDAPPLVIWPGMGVPARYYRPLAGELAGAGFAVHVADLRGTGASSPRPGRSSRHGYADLVEDVGAVQQWVSARTAGRPMTLLGHSLGAQLCLLHLALNKANDVTGVVVVAAGTAYWRTYPRTRGLLTLAQTQGLSATASLLGVWPGWGFGGRQARGVIRDWAYTARHGRFPTLTGIDPEPALAELSTRVLAVSVEGDQYAPQASLDHLCGKLTRTRIEAVRYTTAEAGAPLNHFTWARAASPLARRIHGFAGRH